MSLHYLFTKQHANECLDPKLACISCSLVPVPAPPSKIFKFVLGKSNSKKSCPASFL